MTTSTAESLYWRRLQGFPAHSPSEIEVVVEPRTLGPGDGQWHRAKNNDSIAECLWLSGDLSECVLIADMLIVLRAILGSGLSMERWADGDWTAYSYDELDHGHPEDYEQMCSALHLLSPSDALRQAWNIVDTCPADTHGREVHAYMARVAQTFGDRPEAR